MTIIELVLLVAISIITIVLMAITFRIIFYFISGEGFKKIYKSNKKRTKEMLAYTLGTPIIFLVYCVIAIAAIGFLPYKVNGHTEILKLLLSIGIVVSGIYLIVLFQRVWKDLKEK